MADDNGSSGNSSNSGDSGSSTGDNSSTSSDSGGYSGNTDQTSLGSTSGDYSPGSSLSADNPSGTSVATTPGDPGSSDGGATSSYDTGSLDSSTTSSDMAPSDNNGAMLSPNTTSASIPDPGNDTLGALSSSDASFGQNDGDFFSPSVSDASLYSVPSFTQQPLSLGSNAGSLVDPNTTTLGDLSPDQQSAFLQSVKKWENNNPSTGENNPGNLNFASWETAYGAIPGPSGFASFPSEAQGYAAEQHRFFGMMPSSYTIAQAMSAYTGGPSIDQFGHQADPIGYASKVADDINTAVGTSSYTPSFVQPATGVIDLSGTSNNPYGIGPNLADVQGASLVLGISSYSTPSSPNPIVDPPSQPIDFPTFSQVGSAIAQLTASAGASTPITAFSQVGSAIAQLTASAGASTPITVPTGSNSHYGTSNTGNDPTANPILNTPQTVSPYVAAPTIDVFQMYRPAVQPSATPINAATAAAGASTSGFVPSIARAPQVQTLQHNPFSAMLAMLSKIRTA